MFLCAVREFVRSLGCKESLFNICSSISAGYIETEKLLKAGVKGLFAEGVSIRFHFISKISFKLEWCTHTHTHAHNGVRWGQDSVLFPLSIFQTRQLELHLLPLTASKWKEVKIKPQTMQQGNMSANLHQNRSICQHTHIYNLSHFHVHF